MLPVLRSSGDLLADRRFGYAQAAFEAADHAAAADLAAQVLELAPGYAPAHALLGRARLALGERDLAVVVLNAALAFSAAPASPWASATSRSSSSTPRSRRSRRTRSGSASISPASARCRPTRRLRRPMCGHSSTITPRASTAISRAISTTAAPA
jgi:hypothetical protein